MLNWEKNVKQNRGKWTEEQLKEGIHFGKGVSKREAARWNNIPEKMLTRLEKENFEKTGLGPSSLLWKEAEVKLVELIVTLHANGCLLYTSRCV